mmetsp:Transcript_80821/g.224905  ORF Transcript_80821/g.224905 Transcript_80821/m.224905 type:complete len:100 (-) Transcript_80821:56-355(-)
MLSLILPALKDALFTLRAGLFVVCAAWLLLPRNGRSARARCKGRSDLLVDVDVETEGVCHASDIETHSATAQRAAAQKSGIALLEHYGVFGAPSGSWTS